MCMTDHYPAVQFTSVLDRSELIPDFEVILNSSEPESKKIKPHLTAIVHGKKLFSRFPS